MSWNKLLCNNQDLNLLGTLSGGQSFRWTHNKDSDEWTGVFFKTAWKLRQADDSLQYQVLGSLHKAELIKSKKNTEYNINEFYGALLRNYFRLDMNLVDYYKDWSEKDELFKKACQQFYGIRMLSQEPVENLFSFICSQNNHISRISSMVEKLCKHYGEEICTHNGTPYYSFPEVEKLSEPKVEAQLRKLGFGYRAKFIQKSASQIVEWGGEKWFNSLQDMKYKDARQELMKLHGIGPKVADHICLISLKHLSARPVDTHVNQITAQNYLTCEVADCICLMSLNHLSALPVDTHVYQIAAQNYLPHLRGKKNVTDKMYAEIGDHFRQLYGDMAGWAHTVLFCADLKKFQQNDSSDDPDTCSKPKKKKRK